MDAGKSQGVVKQIVLIKIKDGIPEDQMDQIIKAYAKLVDLIEPLKAFQWGRNVSIENRHQGFTHVFELTFESLQGIAEYMSHPARLEFDKIAHPTVDKGLVVTYEPTPVPL